MTDVSTHLMFQDGSAREAVERYVELIPNSTITEVTGPDGPGQTIRFTLANRPFIAFNSPVTHGFGFTPAVSIFVTCDTPAAGRRAVRRAEHRRVGDDAARRLRLQPSLRLVRRPLRRLVAGWMQLGNVSRTLSHRRLRAFSAPTLAGIASMLSIAALLGCSGDGKSNRVELTESLGCATSYVAKTSDALGVEETGDCVFRGVKISITTFVDNGARSNYVCSTCGFDGDTEAAAIESAARGLGTRLVAGDRYLVGVPDRATEQGARDALL